MEQKFDKTLVEINFKINIIGNADRNKNRRLKIVFTKFINEFEKKISFWTISDKLFQCGSTYH